MQDAIRGGWVGTTTLGVRAPPRYTSHATITTMTPFVAAQLQAIIEDIRLLEAFVTAPLGLYSDIKMLRQSLAFPQAAELSREELQQHRTAFSTLTDTPLDLALSTISSISSTLDALDTTKGNGGSPLTAEWLAQTRRVLARAQRKVAADLRAKTASRVQGIYAILDPEATKGRPVLEIAEATLSGGASVLQLRDKSRDKGEALDTARRLKSLCDQHGALFILNDHADLALASDAHGLHLGRTDLPVAEARRVLAHHQIVGTSNNSVEDAMDSQAEESDYMAVGAVYPTATLGKSDRPAVGPALVAEIKGLVPQPIVAIGGINAGNIADVVQAGADCICVVSAVTLADDPQEATRRLVEAVQNAK